MSLTLNDPLVLAEVHAAFARYEAALLANETEVLDAMFLRESTTVRYGVADIQYGIDEIRAFRAKQHRFVRAKQHRFERRLERLVITSFGAEFATASTLFHRDDFPGQIGRQMQTWVKTDLGWVVAAAHVSMMPER